jgi:hypothetical protein
MIFALDHIAIYAFLGEKRLPEDTGIANIPWNQGTTGSFGRLRIITWRGNVRCA